jgi:hypothetical protein
MSERYRLAPVRDLRDRAERTTKGNLAAAVTDARATEAQVAAAAARVEAARTALAAATAITGGTALALARAEQFAVRRRRELAIAREEHDRAAASHRGQLAIVDAARDQLVRARADRELIERHFARWRADRAKLAERRAD